MSLSTLNHPFDDEGYLATWRGAVNAWECDQMGHMNVQFYLEKANEALAQTRSALGLTSRDLRHHHRSVLPVRERILFQREVHAGDALVVRTAVRGIDDDGHLQLSTVMTNDETGVDAARFDTTARLLDGHSGATVKWGDEFMARAQDFAAAAPNLAPPRAIDGPRAPLTPPDGLPVTMRKSVNAWEVDAVGVAPPRFFMGSYSDAAPQIWGLLGIDRQWMRERHLGSAALDYEMTYGAPIHMAEPIEVRSAYLEVREKIIRFAHYMVKSGTGELVARAEVTAVMFDLKARKSIAVPDELRQKANGILLNGS